MQRRRPRAAHRCRFLTAAAASFHIHLLLLSAVSAAGVDDDADTPAILDTVCAATQTVDPEAFDMSFDTTMEMIYQNVKSSGFGAVGSGEGSNTVFGLAQCMSYLSPTDCQLCYGQARVKLPHCLPADGGRIYLDGCFLRYGGDNFTAAATDASDAAVCSNATAPAGFAAAAAALVRNVTAAAPGAKDYYYAAASGRGAYAAAQCWRSLNASACAACVGSARDQLVRECLPAAPEGYGLNAGCVVRYSTRAFYLPVNAGGGSGSGRSSARRIAVIVVASVLSALLVAMGILFIWTRMRSRSRDDLLHDDMDGSGGMIRAIAASHLSFKYQELRTATGEFSQTNKLGQGGYGSVYKGVLADGREVAVKRLFFSTRQWAEQFFNEVKLVSQVRHKNLVKLLGCSVDGPESLLVYEYLCNTSLDHYLFNALKKAVLDWERRFEIVLGTAEGLSYLHSASEVRIIHRDIKAGNVLLDGRFRPKIADFGLARNIMDDQSHLSTGLAGTFGYMAPEYIVHGQLTEKADIYSYGVLILEIVTGRKSNNSVASSEEGLSLMALIWSHYNTGTLMELLDLNLREQCSEEDALRVFHVGLLCTQASPNLRPPMWKVVEMLSGGREVLPRPTQPPFINITGPNIKSDNFGSPFSLNQLSMSGVQAR
ncbi:cysteine-rich receptor-like protein kinase 2 isoform X7 [Zea mays]|uniref:Cysteine-rich receptor-like protein kinase 2 n=1 Tax=Zea mays TaxID=4577 RepID=A0A804Q198_MAIZE|nr:cysteine-rich receptor-like protein kinase 2 isoform X7 [Zea mays]|eukprot:XP_008649611.1 cysteine-rich receptor-like protein kinase 2 isoform X6 [Zea mays]